MATSLKINLLRWPSDKIIRLYYFWFDVIRSIAYSSSCMATCRYNISCNLMIVSFDEKGGEEGEGGGGGGGLVGSKLPHPPCHRTSVSGHPLQGIWHLSFREVLLH